MDVDIVAAAQLLGLSTATLRKRAQRGTVDAYKGPDGGWLFVVPDAPVEQDTPQDTPDEGRTADVTVVLPVTRPPDSEAGQAGPRQDEGRIAQLEGEILRLHAIIEREQVATAELRRLLAVQLPVLPAQHAATAPQEPENGPIEAETAQTPSAPVERPQRPWWAFWR